MQQERSASDRRVARERRGPRDATAQRDESHEESLRGRTSRDGDADRRAVEKQR